METTDSSAGDRDEQERPDRRCVDRDVVRYRRGTGQEIRLAGRPRHHHAQQQQAQRQHQLVTVDVVARLKQHPHGQHAGHETVDQQHDRPDHHRVGEWTQTSHTQDRLDVDRQVIGTHPDRRIHHQQRQQAGQQQPATSAVNSNANHHRNRQRNPHRQNTLRVLRENARNHQPENGQHDRQGHRQDHQEQDAGSSRNQPTGHLPHRLTPVAKRNHQGAEIVDGSDENRTEQDPQQGRQPAPEHRDRRAHDRTRTRNAREMMAENHFLPRRNKIDPVLQLPTRYRGRSVEIEDLLRQPTTVSVVGHHVADKCPDGDQQRQHRDGSGKKGDRGRGRRDESGAGLL